MFKGESEMHLQDFLDLRLFFFFYEWFGVKQKIYKYFLNHYLGGVTEKMKTLRFTGRRITAWSIVLPQYYLPS